MTILITRKQSLRASKTIVHKNEKEDYKEDKTENEESMIRKT